MIQSNVERIEIYRAKSLSNGAQTVMGQEFPLGEYWTKLILKFNVALTISAGSGAQTDALVRYIKGIFLKSDKGEIFINNAPGRLIYRLNQLLYGNAPLIDTFAASTATYVIQVEIPFVDPRLPNKAQFDTLLDTSRYSLLDLRVTLGTINDLLSSVSGDTVATTLDVYVERFRGMPYAGWKPLMYHAISYIPPQNPNNQTFIDIERSENLSYKRIAICATTGATAGVPMDGAGSDTGVISDLSLEITEKFIMQNNLRDMVKRLNYKEFKFDASPVGFYWHSFVDRSLSNKSVLKSGALSRLRLNWTNVGSLGTNPQVTVGYQALRPLVGVGL